MVESCFFSKFRYFCALRLDMIKNNAVTGQERITKVFNSSAVTVNSSSSSARALSLKGIPSRILIFRHFNMCSNITAIRSTRLGSRTTVLKTFCPKVSEPLTSSDVETHSNCSISRISLSHKSAFESLSLFKADGYHFSQFNEFTKHDNQYFIWGL